MKNIYILCECNFIKTTVKTFINEVIADHNHYKVVDLEDYDHKIKDDKSISVNYLFISRPETKRIDSVLFSFLFNLEIMNDDHSTLESTHQNYHINISNRQVGCLIIDDRLSIEQLKSLIEKLFRHNYGLYKSRNYRTLTIRELQTLHFLLRGYSVMEASVKLGICNKTISAHKMNGLRKIGYNKTNF